VRVKIAQSPELARSSRRASGPCERFKEPDLDTSDRAFLYADGDGFNFMDQTSFET
jgi:translation elongation factor P/translation initiation factor 5A